MQLTLTRDALVSATAWAARALTGSRTLLPVLSGLLLDAQRDGTLAVSGFDYEVSAQARIDAEVPEPGRVLVPGRLLTDLAKAVPAGPVDLHTEGTHLVLAAGPARYELRLLPVEDYPSLPAAPAPAGAVPGAAFAEAAVAAAAAADNDPTVRLDGAYMAVLDGRLRLLTTDRYRMARTHADWQPALDDSKFTAAVPATTLADLAKGLADTDTIHLGATEGLLSLRDGDHRVATTRQTEARVAGMDTKVWPAPDTITTATETDTAALTAVVRRAQLVRRPKEPIRLDIDADSITVAAGTADNSHGRETVPAKLTNGEPITLHIQPEYLLHAVAVAGPGTVRIACTTPHRPLQVTGDGPDQYLIMPVRA